MQHKEMLMKSQFFDQKIFNNLENPMQKLMELNVKTMQKLTYMKPVDLWGMKKPEEFLEKQMELLIENSHMALDYLRDTFTILENQWQNVSGNYEQNAKHMFNEVASTAKKSTKKAVSVAKNVAKKATSATKNTVKTASTETKNTVKKSSAPVKSTAKKMASSTKKDDTKKNIKVNHQGVKASSSATTPEKQDASNKTKSNIQLKEPLNMSKVGSVTEKNNVKDAGEHGISKGNTLPN